MADPGKPADLKEAWTKAGVDIKLPTPAPRSNKNNKRKRKEVAAPSASSGKDAAANPPPSRNFDVKGKKVVVASNGPPTQNSPADKSGLTVGAEPPPLLPSSKVEDADAGLRATGLMSLITDLEACQRVSTNGLALFRQLSEGLAEEMAKQMQGKLTSLYAENNYFAGRLARVQAELDSQRDFRYFNLSLENQSLKEEAEKLKGIQERLTAANAKVAEQRKLLEGLPTFEAERDSAQASLETTRAGVENLKAWVAKLTWLNEEAKIRFGKASANGFQRAVDLAGVLTSDISWSFFDRQHEAREGKIWLGDQMVYDSAEHLEEEEESPVAEGDQVGKA